MGEFFASEDLGKEDQNETSSPKEQSEDKWIPLEGKPGPKIEDLEKRKQPGIKIESATMGDMHYTTGILLRDVDGKICKVTDFELVEDSDRYLGDDSSIKRPKKFVNPVVNIEYIDGVIAKIGPKEKPLIPIYTSRVPALTENEPFYELFHFELRGHDYRLSELVSFGNGVGRLALIVPGENPQVGIVAVEERGKPGPTFLWMMDANEIDYVVHDEKGAIKRNSDNTIFKPTLEQT